MVLIADLLFDPAFRKVKGKERRLSRERGLCLMELHINALFDLGLNILCDLPAFFNEGLLVLLCAGLSVGDHALRLRLHLTDLPFHICEGGHGALPRLVPSSVAAFYSPDGSLTVNGGTPAVGREAITADIRKQVVETKMSVDAQNIKIITQDGKVTLRGPVKTEEEKQMIQKIDLDLAGANNVDNQLEVNNK